MAEQERKSIEEQMQEEMQAGENVNSEPENTQDEPAVACGEAAADNSERGKLLHALSEEAYDSMLPAGEVLNAMKKSFMQYMTKIGSQLRTELVDAAPCENTPEGTPIDAVCYVGVSADQMCAWIFVFPPAFGGADFTKDMMQFALDGAKVSFGLDMGVLMELVIEKTYGIVFTIAQGIAPVNGTDGKIIEKFQREKKINIETSETAKVDYRNLNWVQQVHKGDEICQIIKATPGENGTNVMGAEIRAAEGRTPIVPIGKNTNIDEVKSELVASCDGQITFKNQAFHVEQVLEIAGDVDNSIGNLDAIGNVNIMGNVQDGFTVKATGDITVKGVVEGARLESRHNIVIRGGLKGNMRAMIIAKGDIKCKFIENATVKAEGNVTADSIINSQIMSSMSVEVLTGRGMIIGGEITARDTIRAKVIGNEHNRRIVLKVGTVPDYWEQKRLLEEEIHKLKHENEEIDKNIRFLDRQEELTDEYRVLLGEMRLKFSVQKMRETKKAATLDKLIHDQNPEDSRIQASLLFPPAVIEIGSIQRIVRSNEKMCNIYLAEGEIQIGTK